MNRALRLPAIILIVFLFFQDLSANSNAFDSLYQVGIDHYGEREYLSALEAFRLAEPGYIEQGDQAMLAKTYARIGFILEKLGQEDNARKYYLQSKELFTATDSEDMLHAIVVGSLGLHEQSNQMLMKHTGSPTALNWIGLNLKSLGELDSAIYYHRRVLAEDSNRIWPYILIGNALTEKGEYGQALSQYQIALGLTPPDREVIQYSITTEIGNVNMLMGNYQAAIDNLLFTGLPPEASNLGVAQRNHDLLERAYEQLTKSKSKHNVEYLKMISIATAFILAWFFLRQQSINSKVTLRLNKMYTIYLDAILRRAIQDIDAKKPGDAKKDINMARDLTRKIKSY